LAEGGIPPGPVGAHQSDGKLAYSVSEFSKVSGLSRSLLYEAIKLGELQSIKVRGRRLILAEDGKSWLLSFRRAV
jgi:excisionase family DNA binding protein